MDAHIQYVAASSASRSNNSHLRLTVTPSQIERLYSRFTSLDRSDCGTLSREDFLRIPELAINPLVDRIVHAFFADSNDDRVNFRQFMQVLAHFRPIQKGKANRLNDREEKLKCALNISDCNRGSFLHSFLLCVFNSTQSLSRCTIWMTMSRFRATSCSTFCT